MLVIFTVEIGSKLKSLFSNMSSVVSQRLNDIENGVNDLVKYKQCLFFFINRKFPENTSAQLVVADEDRRKIYVWLGAPDPSSNQHNARDIRHATSDKWLVEGDEFVKWKTTDRSVIWLYGIRKLHVL